jgi:uncharacterized protein YfiM (DUF2279 family)
MPMPAVAVRALLALALVAFVSGVAHAQEADDPVFRDADGNDPTPAPSEPVLLDADVEVEDSVPTESTTAPALASEADALWRAAAQALADSDPEGARDWWREFASLYPNDERAAAASRLADVITAVVLTPERENTITSQAGRVELAIFSTLYGASVGLLLGIEAAEGANSYSSNAPIWLSLGGAGLGLGLSLAVTRGDHVRPSQAALVTSGGVWGYTIGLELVGGTNVFRTCEEDEFYGDEYCTVSSSAIRMVPLAFSAVAVGSTAYIAHRFPDLPAGDIALVNSGGLWGTSTGVLLALLLNLEGDTTPANAMLPATILGLGAGAALAPRLDISRTRVQLINLSGVLGLGLAAAVGSSANTVDASSWGLLLLGGQTAGLATGALVTRNRPASARASNALNSLQVAPTMVGDGTGRQHRGLMLSGRW